MIYRVVALRRADHDVRSIVRWLQTRSPQGAAAWIDAYEQMVQRLIERADAYPQAIECEAFELPLREARFKTRQGRVYRAIFLIAGDQVRILRVRGPGQPPLEADELL